MGVIDLIWDIRYLAKITKKQFFLTKKIFMNRFDGTSPKDKFWEASYMESISKNSGKFIPENVIEKYLELEKDSERLLRLKKKFTGNDQFMLKSMTESVFFDHIEPEKEEVTYRQQAQFIFFNWPEALGSKKDFLLGPTAKTKISIRKKRETMPGERTSRSAQPKTNC